jgi:hypothetical protein
MHLVLNNYRSGSSRFSLDLARDCNLEYYGDVFSDQTSHTPEFVDKFCKTLLDDTKAMPMAVVKCHPADVLRLPNGAELLKRLINRSDKVYMISRKKFDDILRSLNVACCLKQFIGLGHNEEFTIVHDFYVPVTLFEENYFKIMYGNIDLIRTYSRYKNDISLLWYEDIFEEHGRLVRRVNITNPTPPTNINIANVFGQFQLVRNEQ